MFKKILLITLALFFVFNTVGLSFALDKGNKRKGKYIYRKVYTACIERGEVGSKVPPISPADKTKQFGKAGNSLNNFCISTNKTEDKSCLACHPGWGNSTDNAVNCLVCHSRKEMNWDESLEDIAAFLEAGDEESLEIAKEIQTELREAAQYVGRPGRKN